MIKSRLDLKEYLTEDAKANHRKTVRAKIFGDEIWKYILALRKTEYYKNSRKRIAYYLEKIKLHKLSIKLGFQIPINVCERGLSLPHFGTVVIASEAKIGKYCRIHEGVTIGATNGSSKAATVGDRVFIGTGAKIIGEVSVADDCAIAANSVVVSSIEQASTTWGGVPAKKISDNGSDLNLHY